MIRYNSLEVNKKLFCREPETYYESTASFLHHNCIAPVVFLCCINDSDGYSNGLIAELSRARRRRSGAPWVTKFGKPSIRENLVMT